MDMQKPGPPGKVIKYKSRPRGSSREQNSGGRPEGMLVFGIDWCIK